METPANVHRIFAYATDLSADAERLMADTSSAVVRIS
jgi:hypothetical protein